MTRRKLGTLSAHGRSALPLATNGTQEGIARRPEGEPTVDGPKGESQSQPTLLCFLLKGISSFSKYIKNGNWEIPYYENEAAVLYFFLHFICIINDML